MGHILIHKCEVEPNQYKTKRFMQRKQKNSQLMEIRLQARENKGNELFQRLP